MLQSLKKETTMATPTSELWPCTVLCSVAQSYPTFVTLSTTARYAPLSVEFSRQEYLSGLPFPPPEDLPDPEIEPASYVSYFCRGILYFCTTREACTI